MEDKTEEIVKQYPIHVNGKRRIRGAILFEAKEGIFTLIHCRESEKKLSFTEQIKMKLEEQGRREIDMALKTENGSYTTRDKQGNVWILKRTVWKISKNWVAKKKSQEHCIATCVK